MTGVAYYLSEVISTITVVVSLIGIYLSNEVPYRRARRKIMEIISKQLLCSNKVKQTGLYKDYILKRHEIPLIPVLVLIIYLIVALVWNNTQGYGLYDFLFRHLSSVGQPNISVVLPFLLIIILSVFFGAELSFIHISKIVKCKNCVPSKIFLYMLRVKRYELYFLSAAVAISFLFFSKTFSYLIAHYPNFSISFLKSYGTLKSYDSNGLVYAAVSTLIFVIVFYLLPEFVQELFLGHKNNGTFDNYDFKEKVSQTSSRLCIFWRTRNLPSLENLLLFGLINAYND